jgi:hypothetical protein
MRQKNMLVSPAGPGTKNDCAGKEQHQFTHTKAAKQSLMVAKRLFLKLWTWTPIDVFGRLRSFCYF